MRKSQYRYGTAVLFSLYCTALYHTILYYRSALHTYNTVEMSRALLRGRPLRLFVPLQHHIWDSLSSLTATATFYLSLESFRTNTTLVWKLLLFLSICECTTSAGTRSFSRYCLVEFLSNILSRSLVPRCRTRISKQGAERFVRISVSLKPCPTARVPSTDFLCNPMHQPLRTCLRVCVPTCVCVCVCVCVPTYARTAFSVA
mmetsp:Transcript_11732/g.33719  ORF Transcript_11732/g.33719 Transcript_11732/m.33719 type:complete len:202 (-) Transcript_11732:800-1405(-)